MPEPMNILKRLLKGLILVLIVVACEEEITLELNEDENRRIVVEGRLTNELKIQQIRITQTSSYFQHEPTPVPEGIQAYILEEGSGNQYPLTQSNDSASIFETGLMAGRIGENYSLVIEHGDQQYTATSHLDSIVRIDSLMYDYKLESFFGYTFGTYYISIAAYEPPPAGNYYKFDIYINDTLITDDIYESVFANDFMIDGTYLDSTVIYNIPQEWITLDTNRIKVAAISISEDEFTFYMDMMTETFGSGSIFSGPPANISTNIINTSGGTDGVGFFGASARVVKEIIMPMVHDPSTNNPYMEGF